MEDLKKAIQERLNDATNDLSKSNNGLINAYINGRISAFRFVLDFIEIVEP